MPVSHNGIARGSNPRPLRASPFDSGYRRHQQNKTTTKTQLKHKTTKTNKLIYTMPKISDQKIEKISEQILFHLYSIFPKQIFTSDIAKEIARDEEFTKKLLEKLEKKELVIKIDKNPQGFQYSRRLRWRISNRAHNIYKKHQ